MLFSPYIPCGVGYFSNTDRSIALSVVCVHIMAGFLSLLYVGMEGGKVIQVVTAAGNGLADPVAAYTQ